MILQSKSIKSYNNEAETKFITLFEDEKLDNLDLSLDKEILSKINFILSNESFKGKSEELQIINLFRNECPKNIILVGIGKREDFALSKLRKNIAKAVKEAAKLKSKSIDLNIGNFHNIMSLEEIVRTISEAVIMADYKFDKYKSEVKSSLLQEFNLIYAEESQFEAINKAIINKNDNLPDLILFKFNYVSSFCSGYLI